MGDRRTAKRAPGGGTGTNAERGAARSTSVGQAAARGESGTRPTKVRRVDGRPAAQTATTAPRAKQHSGGRVTRPAPRATGRAKRPSGEGTTKRIMRIRELDPQTTCGRGTTVMQLYRVDDLPTDTATTHLVFYDRHGWYCEHGRECPAVAAVRKHEKHNILTR